MQPTPCVAVIDYALPRERDEIEWVYTYICYVEFVRSVKAYKIGGLFLYTNFCVVVVSFA